MNLNGWRARLALWTAAALLVLLPGLALAEEEESPYFENEWNYVDGSIDVSGGIPEDAVGVLGRIREAGALRVATEPYFPPQEFIDPNLSGQEQFVGADMELARLIAQRMGVELVIVPMDFADVLDAVAAGECDLAISGLMYTPGRAAKVELSKGYHYAGNDAGSGLLIRSADAEQIREPRDLAGRDIVAQSGSLQETQMAENVTHYREFRRLSLVQDVYKAVESGRADAAMVDIESAENYIENNPDCGLALVPGVRFVPDEQFDGDRVAGKKGELRLMYFVNGVIDEVLPSGQYEEWFKSYGEYAARLGL